MAAQSSSAVIQSFRQTLRELTYISSQMSEPQKLSAVVDKCLLQGICKLPRPDQDRLLDLLRERFDLVVTVVLIEEVIVNHIEGKLGAARMLELISSFYPFWVEMPFHLIFRELILKENVYLNSQLPPQRAEMFLQAVENPNSLAPDSQRWAAERRKEKEERLLARREHQELRRKTYNPDWLRVPDPAAFMERGIQQLCIEIDHSQEMKVRRLNRYLGRNLKKLYPEGADSIDRAFSEVTFDGLDLTRFTRNYLLAEVLYDLAPISKVGPNQCGHYANLWEQNRGKQINDEDDQQYVAAALGCHHLLTCDKGMHKIADLFAQRGIWSGKSDLIPRIKIDDFLTRRLAL